MIKQINTDGFAVACGDGAQGMLSLPDKSIKLVYGSPPYPNADRDYGNWKSSEYIEKISPFIDAAIPKLTRDGFIVINVKANREKSTSSISSKRSLIVEKLAIMMEEEWGLHCVDIEIWVKENPAPTGLRVACQDAYEQNLWFSVSPKWTINLDAIRRPYESHSVKTYEGYEYKPRSNGNTYVRKNKKIQPNPLGALPKNIITGPVSARIGNHQATQPFYLPEKYIKAVTEEGDLVVDPWLGSGTTGYVAVTLGRRFAGFDMVEEYVNDARNWIAEARREVIANV
ncbi:DNA-methyltransferase [[Ruminococcus] torques]|uniref:DNA-methyltransferase n=1 Tax=[Ruminococcus] torques TaxID=33039 RepID=UPI00242E2F90|nr:site-specific DNA-methyltransferase [[Ruminococcus] torques]